MNEVRSVLNALSLLSQSPCTEIGIREMGFRPDNTSTMGKRIENRMTPKNKSDLRVIRRPFSDGHTDLAIPIAYRKWQTLSISLCFPFLPFRSTAPYGPMFLGMRG